MSAKSTRQLEEAPPAPKDTGAMVLRVKVMSFGYKQGPVPNANVVFDVRFLKNPYWIEELRPLTGLDRPVQDYVLEQPLARELLESIMLLLAKLLPHLEELETSEFIIALGCTGGQHRSATLAETLSNQLTAAYPQYRVITEHRELARKSDEHKVRGQ